MLAHFSPLSFSLGFASAFILSTLMLTALAVVESFERHSRRGGSRKRAASTGTSPRTGTSAPTGSAAPPATTEGCRLTLVPGLSTHLMDSLPIRPTLRPLNSSRLRIGSGDVTVTGASGPLPGVPAA